jgi:hypothetical protein
MTRLIANRQTDKHLDLEDHATGTDRTEDDNREEKQAEYRRAYLEQLKRIACPGCGDGQPLF